MLALCAIAWPAMAADRERAVPSLAAVQPAGQGRLTFLGLSVYDARLWVAPSFRRSSFDEHPMALELTYLRSFRGADIVRRSLAEMQRAGSIDEALSTRWEAALRGLLPDVKPGDRLLGMHRPGRGAEFFHNGRRVGELADPEFSRRFFAIWLDPGTSQPALRSALLEGTLP